MSKLEQSRIIQEMNPKEDKILLCSFATIACLGMKGTGKTRQMQFLAKQYINALKGTEQRITNYYYIAREADDSTINNLPEMCELIQWQPKSQIIDFTCQKILDNYKEAKEVSEIQDVMVQVMEKTFDYTTQKVQSKLIVKQKYEKMINAFKFLHPELVVDGRVHVPQTILVIDDLAVDNPFSKPKGALYQLMINQRHAGVQLITFSVHSIMNIQKQLRETFTTILLFDGEETKRLKTIFDEMRLGKSYFTFDQFKYIYQNYVEAQKDQRGMSHNFLYVMTSPVRQITLNYFVPVETLLVDK